MSVNIVNILAIYDINTLLGRGQARGSVPVPSVIPSVICRHSMLYILSLLS